MSEQRLKGYIAEGTVVKNIHGDELKSINAFLGIDIFGLTVDIEGQNMAMSLVDLPVGPNDLPALLPDTATLPPPGFKLEQARCLIIDSQPKNPPLIFISGKLDHEPFTALVNLTKSPFTIVQDQNVKLWPQYWTAEEMAELKHDEANLQIDIFPQQINLSLS